MHIQEVFETREKGKDGAICTLSKPINNIFFDKRCKKDWRRFEYIPKGRYQLKFIEKIHGHARNTYVYRLYYILGSSQVKDKYYMTINIEQVFGDIHMWLFDCFPVNRNLLHLEDSHKELVKKLKFAEDLVPDLDNIPNATQLLKSLWDAGRITSDDLKGV